MKEQKSEKVSKGRRSKIIINVFLILLIIILILFASAYLGVNIYIDSKLGKVKYENLTNNMEELGISNNNQSNEMSTYRNIALLGLDSKSDTYDTGYRTDCIMIASINEKTHDVQLYSIYRDTYVQMVSNGQTKMDKINHAYYEGVQNTLKTINTNLDLNISEYVIVNFTAVSDLVDCVGGIDIDVDSEEIKYINRYIYAVSQETGKSATNIKKTGNQHLNGVQAVAYCRIRYTSGWDYKRTERMREVLEKVMEKVKKSNISEINNLLDTILPEIRTNISGKEIKSFIPQILSFNIKSSFGWPYKTVGVTLRNQFYGPAATLESNVKKLHQEVYGQINYEVPQSVKNISQKIENETGIKDELK